MKRAVILHGTSGSPDHNWQPWLKIQLENAGYEVLSPLLPNNDKPDQQTYEQFLQESGWDFTDNIVIGHSSGATTVLNLLLADWFPKVKAAVLVAAFLNEKWTKDAGLFPAGNFDGLFTETFAASKLKERAEKFYFVHGSDDPYCDIADAKALCSELKGNFITIPNGHHLGGSSGITELPELVAQLRKDHLL